MSYEGKRLSDLKMPKRQEVEVALLKKLYKYNGVIKEFNSNEDLVDELANDFYLNEEQRNAVLERNYYKENRKVKSPLWHRLLYRAANSLAKQNFVTNPSTTFLLTNRKEWMLTELGINKAMELLSIDASNKDSFPIISYEVKTIAEDLKKQTRPVDYNPFENKKQSSTIKRDFKLRMRGFRQAIIEAYDFKCAVCGLKLISPRFQWEVEAAHIVPYSSNGKDDIWNGLALCRLHHWAFDVGWFSLKDNFEILISRYIENIPPEMGKMHNYNIVHELISNKKISLPKENRIYPHKNSIKWHRENILYK